MAFLCVHLPGLHRLGPARGPARETQDVVGRVAIGPAAPQHLGGRLQHRNYSRVNGVSDANEQVRGRSRRFALRDRGHEHHHRSPVPGVSDETARVISGTIPHVRAAATPYRGGPYETSAVER